MQKLFEKSRKSVSRFPLGKIVATPDALRLLESHGISPMSLLARHVQGDWGMVPPDDQTANDEALQNGGRILSSYILGTNDVLWIITEHDRSTTTILRPSEY